MNSKTEEEIKSAKVIVYSKTYCPYCTEAKNILNRGQVKYEVRELDKMADGAQIQETLYKITNQNTVPNIFIAGRHIGGCSDLKAKIRTS